MDQPTCHVFHLDTFPGYVFGYSCGSKVLLKPFRSERYLSMWQGQERRRREAPFVILRVPMSQPLLPITIKWLFQMADGFSSRARRVFLDLCGLEAPRLAPHCLTSRFKTTEFVSGV